jgi:regulator of sirC expression with transglutaminase-like and TPR domain
MEEKLPNKELIALVQLVDEPDEEIYEQIRLKILNFGATVVPLLETAWESQPDEMVQGRLTDLIHTIQFDNLGQELSNWYHIGTRNLLLGYLLVTRYQYPEINSEKIKSQVDRFTQEIGFEIFDQQTPVEKIKVINNFLFGVYKFEGNRMNFYAPQNYFIETVLESRKGSPLALGMIYLIIAQSLGVPVFGVNLPEHFVLAYADISSEDDSFMKDQSKIQFYINPFSKGTIFHRREIEMFLEQIKVEPLEEYYLPCTNTEIIRRLIRNLSVSYEKLGQKGKVGELQLLLKIISDK